MAAFLCLNVSYAADPASSVVVSNTTTDTLTASVILAANDSSIGSPSYLTPGNVPTAKEAAADSNSLVASGVQHWTLYAGAGQEQIRTPRKVNIDLGEIGGIYRFENGIMLGGFTQMGYLDMYSPNYATNYTGVTVGYSKLIGQFVPYVIYGQGWKTTNNSTAMYNQVQMGSKYNINEKWYVGAEYRYRNSWEVPGGWLTHRWLGTVGYNIDKNWAVAANAGTVTGSWTSNQEYLSLIYKF